MAIVEIEGIQIDTDKVPIEDMPTPIFKEIHRLCGAETAIQLLKNMCGSFITVPSRGLAQIVKRVILNDYNGTTESIRQICRTHKVTESYVRKVLKESRINAPEAGQISLDFCAGGKQDAE